MAEKLDLASARRKMHSPNIKTRKRALKALHDLKRQGGK
ncbi:putative metal homeostasis protein [Weissella halotolerans]|nr:putative metal homeostasis protein [Weissella halotolerans]